MSYELSAIRCRYPPAIDRPPDLPAAGATCAYAHTGHRATDNGQRDNATTTTALQPATTTTTRIPDQQGAPPPFPPPQPPAASSRRRGWPLAISCFAVVVLVAALGRGRF
jgi:hypothetical protein